VTGSSLSVQQRKGTPSFCAAEPPRTVTIVDCPHPTDEPIRVDTGIRPRVRVTLEPTDPGAAAPEPMDEETTVVVDERPDLAAARRRRHRDEDTRAARDRAPHRTPDDIEPPVAALRDRSP
jgi:hypothetical protein